MNICLRAAGDVVRREPKYSVSLTRVPALVDAVVDGPAGDDGDDDVHDEVEEQEGGRHGPVGGGRHAAAGSRSRSRTGRREEGKFAGDSAAVALWFLRCV